MPNAAGVNRFTWNLRYPGVESPKAADLATWDRPDGPLIAPGEYRIALSANGSSADVPFVLTANPIMATEQDDLVAQRDFLLGVLESLDRTNRTIDRVDALRDQLAIWRDRTDDSSLLEGIAVVSADLDEIRGNLIDVNMKGSQLWPSGLHEKFNALLDSADGADYAPPKQAIEVTEQLDGQLIGLIAWLADIESEGLAIVNRSIGAAGLSPIGVREAQ